MILIDFQAILYSSLSVMSQEQRGMLDVNEDFLRHLSLNSIRAYNTKFKREYGEIVLCMDDSSWRKKEFEFYKASRTTDRENSTIDWSIVFAAFDKIRNELDEFFPYRVIKVKGAEADDVIGVLCNEFGVEFGNGEPILIISRDKDFQQLQKYTNVKQFNPIEKKFIKCPNPEKFLIDHIIAGDKGDGIPNVMSKDNSLVMKIRQTPITEKQKKRLQGDFNALSEEEKRNWTRNELLIDLSKTPSAIKQEVLAKYNSQAGKGRSKLFNFFINKRLKNLMGSLSEF